MMRKMHDVTARVARLPAYYMVVPLLAAAVFISYIDRSNISVGAIAMQVQFGWSETQKGLVLSAFFVGYLLMMVVSSALANRYGGKIVLGVAVVWWSLFTSSIYIGTMFALPATGRLVKGYGWPMPFYVFGAAGMVWAAVWFAGVNDGYGVEPPASTVTDSIPWRRLLRLPAVWAIVVGALLLELDLVRAARAAAGLLQ